MSTTTATSPTMLASKVVNDPSAFRSPRNETDSDDPLAIWRNRGQIVSTWNSSPFESLDDLHRSEVDLESPGSTLPDSDFDHVSTPLSATVLMSSICDADHLPTSIEFKKPPQFSRSDIPSGQIEEDRDMFISPFRPNRAAVFRRKQQEQTSRTPCLPLLPLGDGHFRISFCPSQDRSPLSTSMGTKGIPSPFPGKVSTKPTRSSSNEMKHVRFAPSYDSFDSSSGSDSPRASAPSEHLPFSAFKTPLPYVNRKNHVDTSASRYHKVSLLWVVFLIIATFIYSSGDPFVALFRYNIGFHLINILYSMMNVEMRKALQQRHCGYEMTVKHRRRFKTSNRFFANADRSDVGVWLSLGQSPRRSN